MVRWSVLAAGAAVVAGAAFVTGTSIPPKAPPGPIKVEAQAIGVLAHKTGYFNMAAIMRDNKRAKTAVERLNAKKARLAANLDGMKAMHDELKSQLEAEAKKSPAAKDKDREYQLGRELVMISRQIEDAARAGDKLLADRAAEIISEIYDDIRGATAEMAREHGLAAVLAFPDAVTPEEANSPMVKELKLKPPAAQPFYLDPSVDFTQELLERLNAKFAVDNDDK
jgi:Skp family chaperone for outer membrane proteins